MPLKKLQFTPGINREVTSTTNNLGWYDSDKVRFRSGYPEKIGGWQRISSNSFLGVCRSLFPWVTLNSVIYIGTGTNIKFYVASGGVYYDITPVRHTTAAGDVTFSATNGSSVLTVNDTNHGTTQGSYVTFSGATGLGGNVTAAVLNVEYAVLEVLSVNSYTIQLSVTANGSDTGNGGGSTVGAYQINIGTESAVAQSGWGAGPWGLGGWGVGLTSTVELRLWSQSNFGEDLLFGPRGGGIYWWDASVTLPLEQRGVLVADVVGAESVPTVQNRILVSDNRFVFCFGANVQGDIAIDPMFIRWSDQEDFLNWTPAATNQAGSLRLGRGSEIVTALQSRQELLVWTDIALYTLQYQGAPIVWSSQLLDSNTSIIGYNAAVAGANGAVYWMGRDEFYSYNGTVEPLPCSVERYVFDDLNQDQTEQIFSGTINAFYEVWWFYCSLSSSTVDRYVVYNYAEKVWYYGSLARTAWADSGLRRNAIAATYSNNLVDHEVGNDDAEGGVITPISAYITSSDFTAGDDDRFNLVNRVLPDVTFTGSTAAAPSVDMTLYGMKDSGSGRNDPLSESGKSSGTTTRSATAPVEAFTRQINLRVRGRQMSLKLESSTAGTRWQLGSPRFDMRPSGRRG